MNSSRSDIEKLIHLGDQAREQNDFRQALQFYLTAGTKIVKRSWAFNTDRKVRAICSTDINGDGDEEVIIGSEDSKIYVISSQGSPLWSYSTGGWVLGVGAADVDLDGSTEIVAGADKLYIFDHNGQLKKTIETPR